MIARASLVLHWQLWLLPAAALLVPGAARPESTSATEQGSLLARPGSPGAPTPVAVAVCICWMSHESTTLARP